MLCSPALHASTVSRFEPAIQVCPYGQLVWMQATALHQQNSMLSEAQQMTKCANACWHCIARDSWHSTDSGVAPADQYAAWFLLHYDMDCYHYTRCDGQQTRKLGYSHPASWNTPEQDFMPIRLVTTDLHTAVFFLIELGSPRSAASGWPCLLIAAKQSAECV